MENYIHTKIFVNDYLHKNQVPFWHKKRIFICDYDVYKRTYHRGNGNKFFRRLNSLIINGNIDQETVFNNSVIQNLVSLNTALPF